MFFSRGIACVCVCVFVLLLILVLFSSDVGDVFCKPSALVRHRGLIVLQLHCSAAIFVA